MFNNVKLKEKGDPVLRKDQPIKVGLSAKLRSPYKGPYLVIKAKHPFYTIQDRKREFMIHHDK